jgi:TrmH family RNA methyltransferase
VLPLAELAAAGDTLIGLETGGRPLSGYEFPARGILLIGSEELGLSEDARNAVTDIVSIELRGKKKSLNLGVACGIALHAWCAQAYD